jgi:hypothetical protein
MTDFDRFSVYLNVLTVCQLLTQAVSDVMELKFIKAASDLGGLW